MDIENQFSHCKNWDTDLCPHRNNESMKATIPGWPRTYLGSKEQEEVDKLCSDCQSFGSGSKLEL